MLSLDPNLQVGTLALEARASNIIFPSQSLGTSGNKTPQIHRLNCESVATDREEYFVRVAL
jgi:hypothetical protein